MICHTELDGLSKWVDDSFIHLIDNSRLSELKGKPFTGKYDTDGHEIFSSFEIGDAFIGLIIDRRSFVTTQKFLSTVLTNHIFVKFNYLPHLKKEN